MTSTLKKYINQIWQPWLDDNGFTLTEEYKTSTNNIINAVNPYVHLQFAFHPIDGYVTRLMIKIAGHDWIDASVVNPEDVVSYLNRRALQYRNAVESVSIRSDKCVSKAQTQQWLTQDKRNKQQVVIRTKRYELFMKQLTEAGLTLDSLKDPWVDWKRDQGALSSDKALDSYLKLKMSLEQDHQLKDSRYRLLCDLLRLPVLKLDLEE